MIWAFAAAISFAAMDLLWRRVLMQTGFWKALMFRSTFSSVLLLALIVWTGQGLGQGLEDAVPWDANAVIRVFGIPVLTGVGGLLLFSLALRHAPVHLVAAIVNMTGLSVVFWNGWLYPEQIEWSGWLIGSLMAAFTGLAIWLVLSSKLQRSNEGKMAWGLVLSVLAVLTWGRGYVQYAESLKETDALTLAASVELGVFMMASLLTVISRSQVISRAQSQRWNETPWRLLFLVGTGVGFAAWALCMAYDECPAYKVGMVTLLTPVLVVSWSALVAKEKLTMADVVAFLLVLASQVLFVWSEWD